MGVYIRTMKKHQQYNDLVNLFLVVGVVVLATITVINLILNF